jgi:hypothetical protein
MMPEPKRVRAEAALDDVSDHLGVVLQRADELLAQWSTFGTAVRGQVEREAAAIGDAVAGAVDTAVARATASGIDRAITDQVGSRLTALTAEIARLEARTRAAARAVADERMGDRRLLWIVIGGIVLANALLVAILLRRPAVVPAPAEPTKVELTPAPGAQPAPVVPAAASGSAGELQADAPSSNDLPAPAKENATRPEPRSPVPGTRPVGASAAGMAPVPAVQPESGGSAQAPGASAAGIHGAPAAKLPPRASAPKK